MRGEIGHTWQEAELRGRRESGLLEDLQSNEDAFLPHGSQRAPGSGGGRSGAVPAFAAASRWGSRDRTRGVAPPDCTLPCV